MSDNRGWRGDIRSVDMQCGCADRLSLKAKRKVLVIENNPEDFEELRSILEDEYEIIQVSSGRSALSELRRYAEVISVVILEMNMLGMDGYMLMDIMKGDHFLSAIPVVATTSSDDTVVEIRCLESGASDFLTRPYKPEIVKHRIASIIRLRESAAMLNMLKFDYLTGIYSRDYFYRKVVMTLEQNPDKEYDIVCSDVEKFKLINERYGIMRGDELLCYLADTYLKKLKRTELCGRIGGDIFAFLVEHREGYNEHQFALDVEKGFQDAPVLKPVVKFGIYEKVDRSIPVSGMCDRAMLALGKIKNHYGKYVAVYDDSMRLSLLREQRILDEMETALEKKQFQVYYQPKHDTRNGDVSGAEALVRWIHPEFGFMSPGEFIPLFEKNGFITELDLYVWEEVCKTMAFWKKKGLPPISVSVNLSRADFGKYHLAQKIQDLADKYEIPHELLHLEVTESAYTDNAEQIIHVVDELREMGFKIEMDDFGAGYSSLNMLNELSIDVLKLDMRFVQTKSFTRNKSILRFIINLSKWMNLITVAEGAETKEQVDELRSLGCDYVQGYYYAKPMSEEKFEIYLAKA